MPFLQTQMLANATNQLFLVGCGGARRAAGDDLGQPQLHPVPGHCPRHRQGSARQPGRGLGPGRVCAHRAEARRRCDCRAQAQLGHVRR